MIRHDFKELQEQAANGDLKAFSRLYETVYREMYYTAYYSLADETDAVEVITEAVKAAFSAIGRIHTEAAFRQYIMKALCTRIKAKFKQYAAEGREIAYDEERLRPNEDGVDIKQEFNRLADTERLITALYAGGKFLADEISQFTGLSAATVKKKLQRVLELFELD